MRMDPNIVVGLKDGMIYATPITPGSSVTMDDDLVVHVVQRPENDTTSTEDLAAGRFDWAVRPTDRDDI